MGAMNLPKRRGQNPVFGDVYRQQGTQAVEWNSAVLSAT